MKFSIIMPVFNSEKFMEKGINSIIQQTFPYWELILIDDGSTDNSSKICDAYSESDSRIKVIHISNKGPANARNVGLENSTGDYCAFLDSDDYFELDAFGVLYNILSDTIYDLVFYGYSNDVYINGLFKQKSINRIQSQAIESNELFKNNYLKLDDNGFTHPAWNKIFRLAVVKENGIKFPEGINISEDFIFNLQIYENVKRIYILDAILYHYVNYYNSSITSKFIENKIFDIEYVYLNSLEIINRWYPELRQNILNEYLRNVSAYIFSLFSDNCTFTISKKKMIVKTILNNDSIKQCINGIKANNIRNKITRILFINKSVNELLYLGAISKLCHRLRKMNILIKNL